VSFDLNRQEESHESRKFLIPLSMRFKLVTCLDTNLDRTQKRRQRYKLLERTGFAKMELEQRGVQNSESVLWRRPIRPFEIGLNWNSISKIGNIRIQKSGGKRVGKGWQQSVRTLVRPLWRPARSGLKPLRSPRARSATVQDSLLGPGRTATERCSAQLSLGSSCRAPTGADQSHEDKWGEWTIS